MIAIQDIKNILESSEFQKELEEMSSYAASMKQERPIVLLLSKHLWRNGHNSAPELRKYDLDVDGTKIEFKFHYDADVSGVCGEMKRHNLTLETLPQAIQDRILHPTWTATPGIYKDIDILGKKADIFAWIICSRDLSNLTDEQLERICLSGYQEKFRKNSPYERNHEVFDQAEEFLKSLTAKRPCSIQSSTIRTTGSFPSTYHFILCDFGIWSLPESRAFTTTNLI